MNQSAQARWHRYHTEKIEMIRQHDGNVFNQHYGTGQIMSEWGVFEDCNGGQISGKGIFDVKFIRDGKIHPINADNLQIL